MSNTNTDNPPPSPVKKRLFQEDQSMPFSEDIAINKPNMLSKMIGENFEEDLSSLSRQEIQKNIEELQSQII